MTESEKGQPEPQEGNRPFDLKDLESRLKEKGLPQVEGLAQAIVDGVFEWIQEGVQASESKIDDFALAVLPPFKSFIDKKIQGISS